MGVLNFFRTMQKIWNRQTLADGALFNEEFFSLYSNFDRIMDKGDLPVHNSAPAASSVIHITNQATGFAESDGLAIEVGPSGEAIINQQENQGLVIKTNNSERVVVSSDGIVKTDTLSGLTPDHGVDIEGVNIKEGILNISNAAAAWIPSVESVKLVNNVDYAILDNDHYSQIWVTAGLTNRTITLPTLADNQGRVILIGKLDSDAWAVVVDGEGLETMDSCLTIQLPKQNNYLKVVGLPAEWKIIDEAISCQLVLNTYAGYGSIDTTIMRFVNKAEGYGNCISENHTSGYSGNTKGLEITINKPGKYGVSFSTESNNASNIGLSLNSNQLTIDVTGVPAANRLGVHTNSAIYMKGGVSVNRRFEVSDIIRPHADGTINPAPALAVCHFTVTYLGK